MVTVRRAQPEDNAALLDLCAHVPMTGNVALVTRREPDFFALYALQRGHHECWVYADGAQVYGMGTVLVREAWLAGQACRVGYLGDLRARFTGSRLGGLARFYGQIFDEVRERSGCEVFLTAILASNTMAFNSLVRQRPQRLAQPYYHLLRRFYAVSIHLSWRWRSPWRSAWSVRHATTADVPALRAWLDADHRQRLFGYCFDNGELEHRLHHWPGLRLEHTYLAYDQQGQLAGCAAVWDPGAVKRYQVQAYRGHMRWMKQALNVVAAWRGAPRLPEPGECLRTLYVCQVSIGDDNPDIFQALLDHIYTVFRPQGYHFLMVCLYDQDPLAPALRGFLRQPVAFHLYTVSSHSAPQTHYHATRPGFEMVLA